jgi:hypothetical protein
MRKLSEKWRKFWRKFFKILGVTGAALVFQAGYSMRQPDYISGTVRSSATNEPIPKVRVTIYQTSPVQRGINPYRQETVTNSEGRFSSSLPQNYEDLVFIIEFVDDPEDGVDFQRKRIIHRMADGRVVEITLEPVAGAAN